MRDLVLLLTSGGYMFVRCGSRNHYAQTRDTLDRILTHNMHARAGLSKQEYEIINFEAPGGLCLGRILSSEVIGYYTVDNQPKTPADIVPSEDETGS